MVRCDICKTPEFVDRLTKMCEKDPHTYSEMRRIAEYYQEHREISPLSGDAAKVLMREKDPEIEAKALDAVGKNILHGNVPTAKQVKTILENKRAGIVPGGRIQSGQDSRPNHPTPTLKDFLSPENDKVENIEDPEIAPEQEYYIGDVPVLPDEQEKLYEGDVQQKTGVLGDSRTSKPDIVVPADISDIADELKKERVVQAIKDLQKEKKDERERNEIVEKNENTKNCDALVSALKDAMRSALHKGITRKAVFEALRIAIDIVFEPIESNEECKNPQSKLISVGLYK